MRKTLTLLLRQASLLVLLFIVLVFAFWVTYKLFFWAGFPAGNDAGSHIYRTKFILTFWPHINWVYVWAAGMPLFTHYPLLPYLIYAGSTVLFKEIPMSVFINAVGPVSIGLAGFFAGLIAYHFSRRNIFLGLLVALIIVSTPSAYNVAYGAGAYARIWVPSFFAFTLFFTLRFFEGVWKGEWRKWDYFLIILGSSLGLLMHPAVGLIVFPIILIFGLATVRKGQFFQGIVICLKIFALIIALSFFYILPFKVFPAFTTQDPDLERKVLREERLLLKNMVYIFDPGGIAPAATMLPETKDFHLRRMTPFLYPLLGVLVVLSAIFSRSFWKKRPYLFRVSLVFLGISIFAFAYLQNWFTILVIGRSLGAEGDAAVFAEIIVAVIVGLLLYSVFQKQNLATIGAAALAILLVFWAKEQFVFKNAQNALTVGYGAGFGFPYSTTRSKGEGLGLAFPLNEATEKLHLNKDQFNFRFGSQPDGGLGGGFNSLYPYIPQSRHFFVSGVLNMDYATYFQLAVWHWFDNWPETYFNLDWWATKQFVGYNEDFPDIIDKFPGNPNFDLLDARGPFYEVKEPTPILSATNIPAILVIGAKKDAYDNIFIALAQANLNSQYFVPVRGKESIEDYSIQELKQFHLIVLYDYKVKNSGKATRLMQEYVEQGGGILIEANKEKKDFELKSPLPIQKIQRSETDKWNFSQPSGQDILGAINPSEFGPAEYKTADALWNWGLMVAPESDPQAQVLLTQDEIPVVVAQERDRGRIIWSGLNLPFHIRMYKNETEGLVLGKMLAWLNHSSDLSPETQEMGSTQNFVYETAQYKVKFINPEERRVILKEKAQGILFKEAYFQNWHGKVDNQNLTIYKAGPDFMYLPLPDNLPAGSEVVLYYRKKFWPERFGQLVSGLTGLGLLGYLAGLRLGIKDKIKTRLKGKLSRINLGWGEDEDEY